MRSVNISDNVYNKYSVLTRMLILNYKRMKNDFLKFSSRKLFFSAMLVTALSAGASLPAFAGTAGVQSVMQAGTVKGLVVDATVYLKRVQPME